MAAIGDKPFPSSNGLPGDTSGVSDPNRGTASAEPAAGSTVPAGHHMHTTQNDDMLTRVVQGAHQTIDRLADSAAPHVQRLQEGVGARAQQAKAAGDQWTESLRCTVRDNPIAAVASALALGVLLDRLLHR